jgi:hypothetical protein
MVEAHCVGRSHNQEVLAYGAGDLCVDYRSRPGPCRDYKRKGAHAGFHEHGGPPADTIQGTAILMPLRLAASTDTASELPSL